MFGRSKKTPPGERAGEPTSTMLPLTPQRVTRRHGRRGMRSSLTGAELRDPLSRTSRFEADARAAVQLLQHHLGEELAGVHIGFATAPQGDAQNESEQPMFYRINREHRTIVMFRMPIQRARGLHVDDDEHRRYFVEHCVHRAVCEYLGLSPWDVLPGRFDHY